jgi:hypothetical protein
LSAVAVVSCSKVRVDLLASDPQETKLIPVGTAPTAGSLDGVAHAASFVVSLTMNDPLYGE